MSDKERIIKKIRKCLAMGKSSNANEAATAMRQAQKLIEHYKIDISEVGIGEATVEVPVQANLKKVPQDLYYLINIISKASRQPSARQSGFRTTAIS